MNTDLPTRIPPHADGETEIRPPCGGSWLRDADGGLSPGDAATAEAAGLAWPAVADARNNDQPAED